MKELIQRLLANAWWAWSWDIVRGIALYAIVSLVVLYLGQFLTPKASLSYAAPWYVWLAYALRPDIIATALGVAIAVRYVSQPSRTSRSK
jgi:hypothetical protein